MAQLLSNYVWVWFLHRSMVWYDNLVPACIAETIINEMSYLSVKKKITICLETSV